MSHSAKVVWVLGAGFSKSLGGPLLFDLFTHPRLDRLAARSFISDDPGQRWRGVMTRFRELTQLYRYEDINFKPHSDETPWSDPEEFLEMLDASATTGEWIKRLIKAQDARRKLAPHQNPDRMAKDARHYLAAACHEYIPSGPQLESSERWRPYVEWGKLVASDENHTVLTFNYDRVVETATYERLTPLTPLRCEHAPGLPRYLKLHGSVDWVLTQQGHAIERHDPYRAITEDFDILIATPGAGKALQSESMFQSTWKLAEAALRDADAIIFIGYRFPESDAVAKTRVLGAIKANQRPALTIRTVLGTKAGADVDRLDGLLEWSLRKRNRARTDEAAEIMLSAGEPIAKVIHERMGAEDFLSVFEAQGLSEYQQFVR